MKINKLLKDILSKSDDIVLPYKNIDEELTPNMRALRLSMGIGDTLLSMGVAASDVVATCLDITDAYCKRKVQVEITSTLLMFSQDRGDEREPLTLIRAIAPRATNNQQIFHLQELARDIEMGKLKLDDAEKRFDYIITHPDKYPMWLTTIGSASISGGVGMLLTAQLTTIVIMFLAGAVVATMVRILSHHRTPSFFIQVAGAGFITLVASLVAWASRTQDIAILANVNPNYIVIGGIIMLVAGLAVVAAVQDAIDEFYVTANAGLLKVTMMTAGIVAGVLMGLYFAKNLGVWIDLEPSVAKYNQSPFQYIGAIMIAAGYALSTHSRIRGIILAGGIGWLSYTLYTIMDLNSFSVVAASGIAACIAAVTSVMISRLSRVSSISLIMAGIVPLVPGLTLFNGLMEVFSDSSIGASSSDGTIALLNALFIALAIAGGVSLGTLVARPFRRTLIRVHNRLPRRTLRG